MTKRYHNHMQFSFVKRRRVEASFEGGEATSDGGVLLLRETDQKLGLIQAVNRAIQDTRERGRCQHSQIELLRQRIYGLALGYEDLNDHQALRHDGAIQTTVGVLNPLASPSILHRLEQRHDKQSAVILHEVLLQQFIASFTKAPRELIPDFDATHNIVLGEQEGRYFNRFYDEHCFLPLYVFCGQHLLVSYLRPASRGAAHHAPAILKLLVTSMRKVWPKVRIILRADGGFCVPRLLNWCDFAGIDYVIGACYRSPATRPAVNRNGNMANCIKEQKSLFSERTSCHHWWPNQLRLLLSGFAYVLMHGLRRLALQNTVLEIRYSISNVW
ncbi:MAG: IS1380 family transposase [Gammaproteobacteria bacterium]|nr:IS1380 family transposase [Gammaproteobacteria bacterium]